MLAQQTRARGTRVSRYAPGKVSFITVLLLRLAITAAAFGVTAWLLTGMDLSGGVLGAVWVSLLFGVVNAIVGTVVRIVTLPLTLFTLGLFSLIVNAALLKLTDAITSHLSIDEFWWTAIWAAIVLALVTVVLEIGVQLLLARRAGDVRGPAVAA
jgi:putative membrane protein